MNNEDLEEIMSIERTKAGLKLNFKTTILATEQHKHNRLKSAKKLNFRTKYGYYINEIKRRIILGKTEEKSE